MIGDLTAWARGYRQWRRAYYSFDQHRPPFYNPELLSERSMTTILNAVLREHYLPQVTEQLNKELLIMQRFEDRPIGG